MFGTISIDIDTTLNVFALYVINLKFKIIINLKLRGGVKSE